MFCRFCGKSILEDSTFCPYCGNAIEEVNHRENNANLEKKFSDEEYYKRKASQLAGEVLISITKVICYIALGVFLIFNIKMAPSYGLLKFICYVITSGTAIGLVTLFRKKVLPGKKKILYIITLFVSIIVILGSISLRIVYESKVDSVTTQVPSSGEIVVLLSEKTEYYNDTGTGMIRNPSTNVRIGDKWYEGGDKMPVLLNKEYSLRVGTGGSGSGGYTDSSITFRKSSFLNGKYTVTKDVYIKSGPASMAEVNLIFERYCTFWEVVLY